MVRARWRLAINTYVSLSGPVVVVDGMAGVAGGIACEAGVSEGGVVGLAVALVSLANTLRPS